MKIKGKFGEVIVYANDIEETAESQIQTLMDQPMTEGSKVRVMPDYHSLTIESIHNYIDLENGIIRKGTISAQKGEPVIIPLNMADGIIMGEGKGNPDYNFSAPHGAGRIMSRSKAKKSISLEEYQARMNKQGVWSSSVNERTLDEAPQDYKNSEEIKEYLKDTVEVVNHLTPVYNIKDDTEKPKYGKK